MPKKKVKDMERERSVNNEYIFLYIYRNMRISKPENNAEEN